MIEFKIDFNRIKKECPNVYEKFLLNTASVWHYENGIKKITKGHEKDIISNACYCDLESFFDGLEIFINIVKLRFGGEKYSYVFEIYNKYGDNLLFEILNIERIIYLKSRTEAKIAVVYKAFEIAEEQTK